jgi:hypothetical protein
MASDIPYRFSRRSFLQASAAALGALGLHPFRLLPNLAADKPIGLGRVTTSAIYRYAEPGFRSPRMGITRRDELLPILEVIQSPAGPSHNPRWYRLAEGYVHSGSIQRVEGMRLNLPPLPAAPETGLLGEITVPYAQSYRKVGLQWSKLFRLYYSSVHWITGVGAGPRPGVWYRLTDDLLHAHHYVPASTVRPIPPETLTPISAELPPGEKRIEINLPEQKLRAYETGSMVLEADIASGVPTAELQPDELPTDTPAGRFRVQTKMPSRHMGDGRLNPDIEAYELPGVPWVSIFHKDGIALHGTYWHDNFGRRMSHGCVNLRNADALWLYRWTSPLASHQDWFAQGLGTLIEISAE